MNPLQRLIIDSMNALAEMKRSYTLLATMAPLAAKDFAEAMNKLEHSIITAKEFQVKLYGLLK